MEPVITDSDIDFPRRLRLASTHGMALSTRPRTRRLAGRHGPAAGANGLRDGRAA